MEIGKIEDLPLQCPVCKSNAVQGIIKRCGDTIVARVEIVCSLCSLTLSRQVPYVKTVQATESFTQIYNCWKEFQLADIYYNGPERKSFLRRIGRVFSCVGKS